MLLPDCGPAYRAPLRAGVREIGACAYIIFAALARRPSRPGGQKSKVIRTLRSLVDRHLPAAAVEPRVRGMYRRLGVTGAVAVLLLGVMSIESRSAVADDAPAPAPGQCDAWQIEYVVNATVVIRDTTMGAGDGTYPNGPGKMTLRFDNRGGQPGGNVKLMEYEMKDNFTVVSHALMWEARVKADTISRTTHNACGSAAEGALDGRTVRWTGPWRGMRSDGGIICSGGLCGKFGAPPSGRSDLHIAPHPVTFKSFVYAPDLKSFTMDHSVVSQQASPSQTSYIGFGGREVRRTCVPVSPCQ